MTYYTDSSLKTTIQRPSFMARVKVALELRKQRNALYSLTDTQLNDIGVTREEAAIEYNKPFWVHIV